jgi:hypothetical protein
LHALRDPVHTLLVRNHGLRATLRELWRYAQQELGWHKKASRRAVSIDAHHPGF